MIDRYFIEDQVVANEKLATLHETEVHIDHGRKLYIDSVTGEKWEKYEFEYVDTCEDGIGLRKFPYPRIDKIIEIALTTNNTDEVNGAAGLLRELEIYNRIDFREKLWEILDQDSFIIEPARYSILYERAELYDQTNFRETLGKKLNEITRDYEYYKLTAEKAKTLKNKIATNIT